MSRERVDDVRVWCDGCGFARLESRADHIDRAIDECGWIHREDSGVRQDLCPVCRPDSPFDILAKIRDYSGNAGFPADTEVRYAQGCNDVLNDLRRLLAGDYDGGDA